MTEPPRATRLREDKTSSFPSRAVTCAVVYGYFISCAISNNGTDATALNVATASICTFLALSASFARIYFGVHYPSGSSAFYFL